MPKVSVIIPTYNCAPYLPIALNSVLSQTFTDYEIIVIDDGSTDNTQQIVTSFQQANPGKIVYIHQNNQGLACARNTAIKNARGELIALLDADDAWLSDRLQEGVRVMDDDPSVGLVHANITRVNEEGKVISTPVRDTRFLSGHIFEHIFLRKADVSCPTVMFRKDCCDLLGLFDEQLSRLGCEDREMWLRIAQHFKAVYINKVLALYMIRNTSMSKNQEKMLKARLYVIDKFCTDPKYRHLRAPAVAKIYRDLADEMLLNRSFEDAIDQYKVSLRHGPWMLRTWFNFAKALMRLKINTNKTDNGHV